MKKCLLLLVITIVFAGSLYSQELKTESPKQFMQITTVESVLAGGLGRSTNDHYQCRRNTKGYADMENLFSMVGINFKNIKENEDKVIRTLKEYTNAGWKIDHVTSLTLSQNDSGSGGIFMTRYLLSKTEEKKQ